MEPWRVTVVDGQFGRYQGFGIVLAEDADQACAVVVEYLKNDTAYAKPFEVSEVRRHDVPEPHVLVFNWGEWDDYPPKHDSPDAH